MTATALTAIAPVFVAVGAQDARVRFSRGRGLRTRGEVCQRSSPSFSYFQMSWHRRPGNAVDVDLVIDLINDEERRARQGDTIDDD